MIARILGLIAAFVAAGLLATLAVVNRHDVRMVLDPFNPQAPVIFIERPFYEFLFAMLIFGVVLGGVATWLGQGKWRRQLRHRTHEALRWKGEAERLMRERDAGVAAQKAPGAAPKQLALARR